MAIRSSGAYNSPEMAQAAQNIASMFAPPSAQDANAYSAAALNRQKKAQIEDLYANPNQPDFDRRNIAIGNYNPTQSFYAQDQNNSTARYGVDTAAATSRANNMMDNQTNLATSFAGPMDPTKSTLGLSPELADHFGGMPSIQPRAAVAAPMSETQVLGGALQKLPESELIDLVRGKNANTTKQTNGTGLLRDGTQVPAVQGPDGKWRHAQTGAELPSDAKVFNMSQATGTAQEVGLSKPTNSQIEQQLIDITVAKDTATKLRELVASSPSSQGAVGWLRGTAQNVIQTGGELGTFFGGGVQEAMADIEKGLADQNLAGAFDPNIPAIDMMANLLAFQYAKTTTGERLSNEMLNASRKALGLDGLDGNQANSLARLDQAIQQIQAQEDILRRFRAQGVDSPLGAAPSGAPTAPAPAQPMTPPAAQTGQEVWDFDENGNIVRKQ